MKKTAIIAMLLVSVLLFSGCHTRKFMNNAPIFSPDSTWSSDDGRVEFTVDGGSCIGTINVDGETIDVYFSMYGNANIDVYHVEILQKEYRTPSDVIEEWGGDFYSKNEFEVYVVKTTYFTEGETFIVRRVS